jgi:hypothetical protein
MIQREKRGSSLILGELKLHELGSVFSFGRGRK